MDKPKLASENQVNFLSFSFYPLISQFYNYYNLMTDMEQKKKYMSG